MSDICCNKCKLLIEKKVIECSQCAGKYHENCGDIRDLDIQGVNIQGCYRCARSEQRRKYPFLSTHKSTTVSQTNSVSKFSPVFTNNLVRPPSSEIEQSQIPFVDNFTSPELILTNLSNDDLGSLFKSVLEQIKCLPEIKERLDSMDETA